MYICAPRKIMSGKWFYPKPLKISTSGEWERMVVVKEKEGLKLFIIYNSVQVCAISITK